MQPSKKAVLSIVAFCALPYQIHSGELTFRVVKSSIITAVFFARQQCSHSGTKLLELFSPTKAEVTHNRQRSRLGAQTRPGSRLPSPAAAPRNSLNYFLSGHFDS